MSKKKNKKESTMSDTDTLNQILTIVKDTNDRVKAGFTGSAQQPTPVGTGVKVPPARSQADLAPTEQPALQAALVASFAAKYPNVGSHQVPGGGAQRQTLAFYQADVALAQAQARFEEAAALRGDDYLAFGGPTNHDTGDYVWYALQNGQPLSDFYGDNSPVPFDPNFKPKDCGEGYTWDPIASKCVPIDGFFNNVGSLIVPK